MAQSVRCFPYSSWCGDDTFALVLIIFNKEFNVPNFPQQSQFLIYQTEDGRIKIDVRFEDESVWLTQQMMADLFQTSKQNVSHHIKSIFDEGELFSEATVKRILTVQQEGTRQVQRQLEYYNLDMIISVGYRVKSHVATRFRIWATQQLREFIVKGFVLDDERLKNPDHPFDYFEELLRRIQDIRTSERRFYQKITDIYATSIDYDPTTEESITFFKTVQNKLHWAVTGMTAAELIHSRADSGKPYMGLTSWPDILHEFYRVAFRKKIYKSLEELQTDLDQWLDHYNNERTHQGKMCCGRTPMQTFLDGKKIWEEKVGQLNLSD